MADIKWNSAGFRAILCSEGARQVCEQAGAEIQARANAGITSSNSVGFKMHSEYVNAYGSRRNMTFVYTTDHASMVAEAEDKVLSKAVY